MLPDELKKSVESYLTLNSKNRLKFQKSDPLAVVVLMKPIR